MSEHARYQDDVGAYLLGALNDLERQAFERHLRGCAECQEELARLRPAADALPGSVQQFEPPARLKASLMEVVEREARAERGSAPPSRRRGSASSIASRVVAAVLLLGLVVGFGVAQLGGDETRTVAVTVDKAMPRGRWNARHRGRRRAPCSCTTCRNFVARASTRCGSSTATSWFPRARLRSERVGPAACSCAGWTTPTACT